MSSRYPDRVRAQTKRDGASEADIIAADPDIDMLVQPDAVDIDFDWVPAGSTGPKPYKDTWMRVYVPLVPAGGGFTIGCAEGGDGDIEMIGAYKEVEAHINRPQRPPVCHIFPWVLLHDALVNSQQKNGKTYSPGFNQHVCWGDVSNLRTGHRRCNAADEKVTVANSTGSQRAEAIFRLKACENNYGGSRWL